MGYTIATSRTIRLAIHRRVDVRHEPFWLRMMHAVRQSGGTESCCMCAHQRREHKALCASCSRPATGAPWTTRRHSAMRFCGDCVTELAEVVRVTALGWCTTLHDACRTESTPVLRSGCRRKM